jgi:hypothetical protein
MPTTITALPTPPSTADPANFDTRADAFLGALPTFRTETNTVVSELNVISNTTVPALVVQAEDARDDAQSAEATALASANYKGTWASLGTGSVTRPASVSHSGAYWMLVPASLANASLSQPGITADWIQIYNGGLPLYYYNLGLI